MFFYLFFNTSGSKARGVLVYLRLSLLNSIHLPDSCEEKVFNEIYSFLSLRK